MNGKQLKNSILQWAIQGKLVPQDPNDEPASVLLDKIRQEKERLIKEKKIKRDKNASIIYRGEDNSYYEKILATGEVKCIDEEIPFEIPQGWEWCRLKHICSMQAGKNISASRIFSDKTELHPYRCVGGNGLRGYTGEFNTQGHYSIVGRQGALCGCINIEKGKFYATEHAVVVDTYEILSPLFMYYFLMALNLNKYATATAQPGLAVSNVLEVMCPLPPLNEGERIIKKLALLIPLVENYNAIQEKQNALNSSIKERLKKSILQEAIQGKLIPQIAEEGTAQELLEQIKAEKQNLVKEGKLKKSALATSVIFRGDDNRYYEKIGKKCLDITDEIPFDIPENWQWIKLDQGISLLSGRDLEPSQYNDLHHGIPYITGASNFVNSNLIINRWTEAPITISNKGDLLLTCKGTIGSMAFNDIGQIHIARQVMAITSYGIDLKYIKCFLQSNLSILEKNANSMIPGISRSTLLGMLFPLPPFKEQQRIVAQIEKLFEQLH